MRVYIGPYTNRWVSNVHNSYMMKRYGYDWYDNHNKFEHFLEKVEETLQSFYNKTINKILDRRERKIKIKIDDYDVWSMDHTLSHIIEPMLILLKEKRHGSPMVNDEDVPEHLRSTAAPPKSNDYDIDDLHEARWEWILDEMIWTFGQKTRNDWESDYYEFEGHENGFLNMRMTKNNVEGRKAHQARMTNGFRLFGKYFEALWD